MPVHKERPCPLIDGDLEYTAKGLISLLLDVMTEYGPGATVRFDAGHNNVSVMVTPSRKVKESK